MDEIVVVVPVLGRPRNADPVADSFRAARTVPSRLLFVCTEGDDAQIAACADASGDDVALCVMEGHRQPGDFARKVNYAYRLTADPLLFQAADDVEFTPGWDAAAAAVHRETGAGVIGTNDDGNRRVMAGLHSTHSLIARRYIEEKGGSMDGPGVVFHEGYGHQYADTELVELAKIRGEWAFATGAVVRHNHPFWGRGKMDATYEKGLATGATDRRLYKLRERTFR